MCLVLNTLWFKLWHFLTVKRFLELLVPEINRSFNSLILFFSNMAKSKAEFRLNGVKDFLVKHETH